jgi:predicted amidohydrolase YtcJ
VNSAALTAAGITEATPDPPGGKIAHPLGVFLDTAHALITDREPPLSDETVAAYVKSGQAKLLAAGITSAVEGGMESLQVARTYAKLDAGGELKQRAFLWAPLWGSDVEFQEWIDFSRTLPAEGKVHVVTCKGFLDGTMVARTAALLAPYADAPDTQGTLNYPFQTVLNSRVIRANKAGLPVALHAIGDRAVRQALDAFENSKAVLGHSLTNRVEHANVVDPVDVPRFGTIGVAASVQPAWLYAYPTLASFTYLNRIGEARAPTAFAWRTLAQGGATLVFGSDAPSSELFDPISGIFAAMTRQFFNGETFLPSEALDGDAAVRAYTSAQPSIMGWGTRLGKLAPGHYADIVWLGRDPRLGARSVAEDPIKGIWIGGAETAIP